MTILTTDTPTSAASVALPGLDAYLGTDIGLIKTLNEDRIGYSVSKDGQLTLCIADGHWGDEAAELASRYWLSVPDIADKETAVMHTAKLEHAARELYAKDTLNETMDRPPEAAFIRATINASKLQVISYGDCRLCIVRKGAVRYTQPTDPTWLGAFSHLGLRQRLPITTALRYKELDIADGDTLLLFTDGVDECVYEKPTLTLAQLASLVSQPSPARGYEAVMNTVRQCGAEDNASLAICSIHKAAEKLGVSAE